MALFNEYVSIYAKISVFDSPYLRILVFDFEYSKIFIPIYNCMQF